MGAHIDSAPPAFAGYLPAQLIAHSYLGGLWIALDQRHGTPGRPVLLRRLQLQEGIPSEALQRMASMDEPLVMELPRRPGQKETRWTHLVGDVAEPAPVSQRAPLAEPELPAGPLPGALSARVAKLEEIVAKLAEDVETLKSLL